MTVYFCVSTVVVTDAVTTVGEIPENGVVFFSWIELFQNRHRYHDYHTNHVASDYICCRHSMLPNLAYLGCLLGSVIAFINGKCVVGRAMYWTTVGCRPEVLCNPTGLRTLLRACTLNYSASMWATAGPSDSMVQISSLCYLVYIEKA